MRTAKQWALLAAMTTAALFAATIVLGAPGDKVDIRIELPSLAGDYHIGNNTPSQDPTGRTTTFVLPDSVVGVGLMRLTISATWHMGVVELTRPGIPATPDTFRWVIPLQMEISAPSLGECYLFSYAGGQEGYWIDGDYFYPECPSGDLRVSDLVGLDLSVNFYCRFEEREGKRLIEDAFGTVHSVSVELLSAVPNEDTTWGAVKALYR